MFLIDANVLIDIAAAGPATSETLWSMQALADCGDRGTLGINPVIYAEVSAPYRSALDFERAYGDRDIDRLDLPYPAAFIAAKAHAVYRERGGTRRSALPDFFIGAHALVAGLILVTRDPRPYRTYFPTVELICP